MSDKLTIEYIKQQTEILSNGKYKCLSNAYIGWDSKLKFKCDKGHIYNTCWYNFKSGCRCPICKKVFRYTTKDIADIMWKKRGYYLLSEYKSAKEKLLVMCSKKHIYYTTWDHFRRGVYCRECGPRALITIEKIRAFCKKIGYTLVSEEYLGPHSKLYLLCNNNHKVITTWAHLQQGGRCKKCTRNELQKILLRKVSNLEVKKYQEYRYTVTIFTNRNVRKYNYLINPKNIKRSRKYHLDHIYSVIDGFKNGIDAKLVAHPCNLRIVTSKYNFKKNSNSDITIEELKHRIELFNEENIYVYENEPACS